LVYFFAKTLGGGYYLKVRSKKYEGEETHTSKRDAIRKSLTEQGIPTMVYYPIELHKQEAFAKYWDQTKTFPVAEGLVQTVLSLPMHTEMRHAECI
jgi:dTDP-4-amino-4,6-dideoxygalactose transaminase